MFKRSLLLAALGGLFALPACTSGQSAVEPAYTPANLATSAELQFQVGTANLNGTAGLNTVVTFRQTNGLSAALVNTPTITLPFTNTGATGSNTDAGTNHISGTPQTVPGNPAPTTTFNQTVGAFAYGFLASNATTSGADNSTFYPAANRMPYYGAGTPRAYYIGPGSPMVPNFKDNTFPPTFLGYPSGFTTFALTPTTGAYSLTVALQSANATVPSFTATTALNSLTMLPVMPAPAYVSDAAGGGTVTVVVPPGVTETLVEVVDTTAGYYYSLIIHGTGAQTATLADNLGQVTAGVGGPSIAAGHGYRAIAVGFDYPAMEAVPVGSNPPEAPVINNAGTACAFSGTSSTCPGQADITVSAAATGTE